jgi:hypothetical protein
MPFDTHTIGDYIPSSGRFNVQLRELSGFQRFNAFNDATEVTH